MNGKTAALASITALALCLGAASRWPLADSGAVLWALFHAAFLAAALAAAFLALPRFFSLPVQIFIAMVAGVAAGAVFRHFGDAPFLSDYLGIFGKLFILLLTVVIVPLIFVSVLNGTAGVGDVRRLGPLGVKTLLYYLLTTCVVVLIGLALVNLLRPGEGREGLVSSAATQAAAEKGAGLGRIIQEEALPAVIKNPVMAGQNPLAVIFFAVILGAALAAGGAQAKPALEVFAALDRALTLIILAVMRLAPLGVFALMSRAIAELGVEYVLTLGQYCLTVMLGLVLHFCLLTLVVCPLLGRMPARRFLRGMFPAFEVAFSTSSSSATLPVTMRCVTERLGVDKNISSFMLPLGATVNMDGTALYLSVASLFVAQVYGLDLSVQAQFMVFLTAVLASIGTAGIPGASLGLMGIIFTAAGIPAEGIGIVIGVDRLFDMSRTVVNITGDAVGAVVVARGGDGGADGSA